MKPSTSSPALAERLADFLKRFPPFSYLKNKELLWISQRVKVRYAPAQTTIFEQGQDPLEDFFIVNKGAVGLFRTEESVHLIDQLDEGDVFGIRPLMAKQKYAVTARVSEESLLYAIPIKSFEPLIDKNSRVARFLATSFAGGVRNPNKVDTPGRVLMESEVDTGKGRIGNEKRKQLVDLARVPISRKALTCPPHIKIQQAAIRMSSESVGTIVIVDPNEHPIGLITDRDLRKKVVTGLFDSSLPIAEIMRSPVVTILPDQRIVDVQLAMVRNRIHHLVVTEDGTTKSRVLGVLSNRDVLLALGSSPAAVVREIEFATTSAELQNLRERAEAWLYPIVDQRGSMYAAAKIMTEINDQITRRCIFLAMSALSEKGIESPPLAFCWLSLGSQGRGEQLLRTDQDHAIVIADGNKEDLEISRSYYVQMADLTSNYMAEVGYDRCIGDMMAANPAWCLSYSEWKNQLDEWVTNPNGTNLLNASTLLDRRPVYGDIDLGEELCTFTRNRVKGERLLLAFLAKAAMDNPPPLSFFRSFVVERGGEHKDEFDIKQRAMLPLVDAARVLTLDLGISDPPNTIDRFDRLRVAEPQNAELFHAAAQAYDTLMLFRARQGFSDKGEGRYFQIKKISKLERLQLRNTFVPIEELLSVLKLRFQVNMLNQ